MMLDKIPFTLDRVAFRERVRVTPDSGLVEELDDLLDSLLPVLSPKGVFISLEPVLSETGAATAEATAEVTLRSPFSTATFKSSVLAQNVSRSKRLYAYLATCGTEVDSAFPIASDPLSAYWVDAVKELAVYAASEALVSAISSSSLEGATPLGGPHLASMNPGSGNTDLWPIADQKPLFSLFGGAEDRLGVRLLPSMLMEPNKTISGLFFETEDGWTSCRHCSRPDCPNRQEPSDML